jgi:hypothetical protein
MAEACAGHDQAKSGRHDADEDGKKRRVPGDAAARAAGKAGETPEPAAGEALLGLSRDGAFYVSIGWKREVQRERME